MKLRDFMDVVPRSFKRGALAVAVCSVATGLVVTVVGMMRHSPISAHDRALPFGVGLLGAVFLSILILCLGYVHADAVRRAMPPWLWTLVALFIPNLLGFLLYFACRRPLATPCPHCSQWNAPGQRFCSWCGHPASGPLASGGSLA